MNGTAGLRIVCTTLVAALSVLCVAWELWLAPLRPDGSTLVLKAVPLALVLPALWRGRVRAYQWWSMLILLYACEGLVRGLSDATATSRLLGWIEAGLATAAFGSILAYVRATRASPR